VRWYQGKLLYEGATEAGSSWSRSHPSAADAVSARAGIRVLDPVRKTRWCRHSRFPAESRA
jgi:hypothetical protein